MRTLRAAAKTAVLPFLTCCLAGASAAPASAVTYGVDFEPAARTIVVTAPAGGQRDTFSIFRLDDEGYVWTHDSASRYAVSASAAAAGCQDLVGQFPYGNGFLRCPLDANRREIRVSGSDGDDIFYPGFTNQPLPYPMRVGIDDGPGADIVQSHLAVADQTQFDAFQIAINAGSGNDQYIASPGNQQMRVSYAHRTEPVDGIATGRWGSSSGNGSGYESDSFIGVFSLEGGTGPDSLETLEHRAVLRGGDGADTLRDGHGGFHLLHGDGGDDRLIASGPGSSTGGDGIVRDELRGGPGSDTADYSEATGAARLQPGTSANGLSGEATLIGDDVENLRGGDGDDVLLGSAGPNTILPGIGDDFIRAGAGSDTIDAVDSRSFVDDIGCGADGDTVTADLGFDLVAADCETVRGAPDAVATANTNQGGGVAGASGSGIPSLADCDNRVAGSRNRDRMLGTTGDDRLLGRRGDDLMRGVGGRDCLLGNTGDDRVVGGASPDRLIGGPGDDVIRARDGVRDLVKCGAGKGDRVVADRVDLVIACERRRIR